MFCILSGVEYTHTSSEREEEKSFPEKSNWLSITGERCIAFFVITENKQPPHNYQENHPFAPDPLSSLPLHSIVISSPSFILSELLSPTSPVSSVLLLSRNLTFFISPILSLQAYLLNIPTSQHPKPSQLPYIFLFSIDLLIAVTACSSSSSSLHPDRHRHSHLCRHHHSIIRSSREHGVTST